MNISQQAIELIKKFEKLENIAYYCPAQKKTIGYGHVIQASEHLDFITNAQADELLKKDLQVTQTTINKGVVVPLSQNQFDALVSLVYNWGGGNFLRSVGRAKLNQGDYAGAWEEFKQVIHINKEVSKGLVNRRIAEGKLFMLSGYNNA